MKNTRWLRHLVFFTRFFLSFVGEYLSIPLRGSQHIAPLLCITTPRLLCKYFRCCSLQRSEPYSRTCHLRSECRIGFSSCHPTSTGCMVPRPANPCWVQYSHEDSGMMIQNYPEYEGLSWYKLQRPLTAPRLPRSPK